MNSTPRPRSSAPSKAARCKRLGGHREIAINIRIIAATNHNLEQLTSQQKFRQDLYFRLNVARIPLPPLRDHKEDLPALVDHLPGRADAAARPARRNGRSQLSRAAAALRLAGATSASCATSSRRPSFSATPGASPRAISHPTSGLSSPARQGCGDSERETIVAALQATAWNRSEAARRLGCSRMTLYRKMVKYDLFPADDDEDEACNLPAGA